MRWWSQWGGKRLLDLALSLAGLAFFAVPIAWIAWKIWKDSGGPILFPQTRIGLGGKTFQIWKFRTMTGEGRVTRFGNLLRATAMDELPQLVNILKGEMSFVGPRPLIPRELQELDRVPQGQRRLGVRPGLTGLAQLYSEKIPTLSERLRWDILYVDRCSLWEDARILLKSLGITLRAAWEFPGPKLRPKDS